MTGSLDDGRRNNFDALRIMAALMVIHGHGWDLTGGPASGLWGVPFARAGLDVFFSISGYLVTGSWERTPRFGAFLAKRAWRIFPGLATCVTATIVAVGFLATTQPAGAYFTCAATYGYLSNIALYQHLWLPGAFKGQRELGAVNGSLWSLLPEFLCYLTVPVFALLRGKARLWALAVGAALSGGIGLYMFEAYGGPAVVVYHMDVKYALVEMPFFFMGGLFALAERRFAGLWRADLALLFFVANYSVSSWFDWWNIPLEWFTMPYMVIAFGRMGLPLLRRAGRFGDISYGLYLYAYPIQQLVLARMPGDPYPVLTCVALTIPAAFLSWHLIERPALRWGGQRERNMPRSPRRTGGVGSAAAVGGASPGPVQPE